MFQLSDYPFDTERNCHFVANEAMVFHCHHYVISLQNKILNADYVDSRPFLIGAAAHALHHQLSNLCDGLASDHRLRTIETAYKTFGFGLVDLSGLKGEGGVVIAAKSVISKMWRRKFGNSDTPVDFYTCGFLAAAYSVHSRVPLDQVQVEQTSCMALGDEVNTFEVKRGERNFTLYPAKKTTDFKSVQRNRLNWADEARVTDLYLHQQMTFCGNEDGMIAEFGAYLLRTQVDWINRVQLEFFKAVTEVTGAYGPTLATELLMEVGYECGYFTYGGIMSSPLWRSEIQPGLMSREDWVHALLAAINSMGWGYHTVLELSETYARFRIYHDFEDLSYFRLHGPRDYPDKWVNTGGFAGLMHLIYATDFVRGTHFVSEESFRELKRGTGLYRVRTLKSIADGDDFLEVEIFH